MRIVRNLIIVMAAVSIVGIGVNGFAHGGRGWGGGGSDGSGRGCQGGPCYGENLTEEEYEAVDQKREAFFAEQQDLRTSLLEKEREIQSELDKSEPDVTIASQLQKEISELRSQLDQKRIDHLIEMRKLNPDAGRGYMRGGKGKGYGSGGRGSCWR